MMQIWLWVISSLLEYMYMYVHTCTHQWCKGKQHPQCLCWHMFRLATRSSLEILGPPLKNVLGGKDSSLSASQETHAPNTGDEDS